MLLLAFCAQFCAPLSIENILVRSLSLCFCLLLTSWGPFRPVRYGSGPGPGQKQGVRVPMLTPKWYILGLCVYRIYRLFVHHRVCPRCVYMWRVCKDVFVHGLCVRCVCYCVTRVCVNMFVHRVSVNVSVRRICETSVRALSANSRRRKAIREEFLHILATA